MRPGELIGDRFRLEGLAGAGGMAAKAGVESGEAAIAPSLAESLHALGDEARSLERGRENARTFELARGWVAA